MISLFRIARRPDPRMAIVSAPLPHIVTAALAAANAGDTEAFLDCFTEAGFVDDWGRQFAGREAIQGWSDAEFIGMNVSLKVTGQITDGRVSTVAAQVGGSGFNGPSHFAFDVAGDRLLSMTITG
jgi:hypothetical protein